MMIRTPLAAGLAIAMLSTSLLVHVQNAAKIVPAVKLQAPATLP